MYAFTYEYVLDRSSHTHSWRLVSARDLKVVLYCKTSGRAALAARAMHDMGYLQVQSIAGGFDAWVAAGKPVAAPASPSFD